MSTFNLKDISHYVTTKIMPAVLYEADPALLTTRRKVQLDEMVRETQVFSRKARLPEDRIALAEIERELLLLRKRWEAEGKLNGQEELPLAETGGNGR